jgi:WD40 repeat protein
MAALIPNTTPIRTFEDHGDRVVTVATLHRQRMVTGSYDGILRLWDLKTGIMLKKMEGHHSRVRALAVSPDGERIASGDESGELIAWYGQIFFEFHGACQWIIRHHHKAMVHAVL